MACLCNNQKILEIPIFSCQPTWSTILRLVLGHTIVSAKLLWGRLGRRGQQDSARCEPNLHESIDNCAGAEGVANNHTHFEEVELRILEVCEGSSVWLIGLEEPRRFLLMVAGLGWVLLWWPSICSLMSTLII
jgi:hypothetical protein